MPAMACKVYCTRARPLSERISRTESTDGASEMKETRKFAAAITVGCSGSSKAATPDTAKGQVSE